MNKNDHCNNECRSDNCILDEGATRLFLPITPSATGDGDTAILTIPAGGSLTVLVGDQLLAGAGGTIPTVPLVACTRASFVNFSQASAFAPLIGTIFYPATAASSPPAFAADPSLASFQASLSLGPSISIISPVALTITNLGGTASIPLGPYGVFPLIFIRNGGNLCDCRCGRPAIKRPAIFFQTTDAPTLLSSSGQLQVSSLFTAADVPALAVNPLLLCKCPNFGRRFAVYGITGPGIYGTPSSAPSTRAAALVGYVNVCVTSTSPLTVTAVTENNCNLLLPSNAIFVETSKDCKSGKESTPIIDIFQFGAETSTIPIP